MHVQPFYCCRAFITVSNSWVLGPFTSTPASSSHFQQQTHGCVYSHTLVGTFAPWCQKIRRRQWQRTPVLLPGKSHGRRSPVGCSRWGREELGVGHDWATSLSLFTFMHWGRKWQPIPVFLPGESQGRGSLVGCCLWGHTESDRSDLAAAVRSQEQQAGHQGWVL